MPWLQITSTSAIFICPICHCAHIDKPCLEGVEELLMDMKIGELIDDNDISKEMFKLAIRKRNRQK